MSSKLEAPPHSLCIFRIHVLSFIFSAIGPASASDGHAADFCVCVCMLFSDVYYSTAFIVFKRKLHLIKREKCINTVFIKYSFQIIYFSF